MSCQHRKQNPVAVLLARGRPVVLALLLLCLLPARRSLGEEHVDLTLGYYLEDNHRVEVWSPALLWEMDVNPSTVFRLQGTYDVVSGASPTGAPPQRQTKAVTTETVASSSQRVITGYQFISGPTPGSPGTQVPVYGNVSSSTRIKQTKLVPFGPPILPLQTFKDQRLGIDMEWEHHSDDWVYTGGLAVGNESDYTSLAGTAKIGREFNHKATLVTFGVSLDHDWVRDPVQHKWEPKDTQESILGLTQAIDPKTLLTLSGTLGAAQGYLDDQYKYASVNGLIEHEKRPDSRERRVAMLLLNRTFDSLHGSLEASYRFYNDSYGIDAHTFGLAWYQHLGKYVILSPSVRYYQQSAADFYAVSFAGNPVNFSSDYRLSKLATLTYGLKLVVKLSGRVNFNVSYDRYTMWGRDGVTSQDAYPSANIMSMGFRLWF